MVDVVDAGGDYCSQLANDDGYFEAGKLLPQAASLSENILEGIVDKHAFFVQFALSMSSGDVQRVVF